MAVGDPDFDELLGMRHRQRAQAYRVEQLEDRRVRPDAEREREDGDDGKSWIEPQQSQAVSQVLPDRLEEAEGVHAVDLLADLRDVAQLAARRVARLGAAHPARDVLVGLDRQMRVELARPLVVPRAAIEKTSPAHVQLLNS